MRGGFGMILLTPKDTTRFRSSTFDVGQSSNGGFKIDRCDLEPCMYQILTSMGKSEKAQRITKHEVVI
jgi:hypothetical protein